MPARINYQWDPVRLYLHFGFASCVVLQLLSSLVMHRPYLGRKLSFIQSAAFTLHSYSGLLTTLLILAYWYWIMRYSSVALRHLFGWLTVTGALEILQDLKTLFRLKLLNAQLAGGLPGFIQGLGLLLISFLGLCGTLLFFALPKTQQLPQWVVWIKELHASFGSLVWWYLGGHSGMALLHCLIKFMRK